MKKKMYSFGFLAAALIIVPNAAFAQNYGANRSMEPTAIITSNDNWDNQTESQNTRQSETEIRSGSLCSSSGKFANSPASNRGALVSNSYNRANQRVPQRTLQNRVNEVLRSFCN
jgi:hypothetical protein